MPSTEVRVRTPGGAYGVLVERGVLARAGHEFDTIAQGRPWVVITDGNVWKRWGRPLKAALGNRRFEVVRISPGESQKRMATAESLCERLVEAGADRSSLVIGFGGGVIGDLAGFVASIYLRGVEFVQLPTTLLAQIDSSVGGKTGVNLVGGKNLVGTFYQPKRVLADPEVLRTLPERELNAGLYEAIKTGMLRRPLFEFIERNIQALRRQDLDTLGELVRQCVEVKASVVTRDERERGLRRILNLGHTIGHALEAETGYKYFLHGEAVGWGLRAATMLAERRGLLPSRDADRIQRVVSGLGPPPALPKLSPARLARLVQADKKTRAGVVHYVLPVKIGQVEVVTGIEPAEVASVMDTLRKDNPRAQ